MSKKTIPAIRFKGFMDEWEQRKVSGVAERYDNLRVPVAASLRKAGSTPYYGANGIQDYVDGFTHNGEFILVAEDGANDLKNYPVNYVNGRIWVNNHAHVLQGKISEADTRFLGYSISQTDIESVLVGGGRAKLNADVLMNIELMMPEKSEQQKIGSFFASLGKNIAFHQRKLTKLQLLKKSMLTKMFPKDGARVPEIRFQGFHGDWEHHTLRDISDIKTGPFGSALHADDYVSEGVPIITTEHFKSGHLPTSKMGIPQVSREDYARLSSYILNIGDIVFSRVGSVDINALVTQAQSRWLFSGRVLRVRIKDLTDAGFLHIALETSHVRNDIVSRAVGQTMPCINTEILGDTFVLMPMSIAEQKQIAQYFSHLERLIISHQQKLSKLQQIKQAMLSKLFV